MRKISNFCGIFAALFVTTTMVLLASCSQDDDNYDSDMYTLAEMGTRISDPTEGGGTSHGHYSFETVVTETVELEGSSPQTVRIYLLYETPSLDSLVTCKVTDNDRYLTISCDIEEQSMNDDAYAINLNFLISDYNSHDNITIQREDTIQKSSFTYKNK